MEEKKVSKGLVGAIIEAAAVLIRCKCCSERERNRWSQVSTLRETSPAYCGRRPLTPRQAQALLSSVSGCRMHFNVGLSVWQRQDDTSASSRKVALLSCSVLFDRSIPSRRQLCHQLLQLQFEYQAAQLALPLALFNNTDLPQVLFSPISRLPVGVDVYTLTLAH